MVIDDDLKLAASIEIHCPMHYRIVHAETLCLSCRVFDREEETSEWVEFGPVDILRPVGHRLLSWFPSMEWGVSVRGRG